MFVGSAPDSYTECFINLVLFTKQLQHLATYLAAVAIYKQDKTYETSCIEKLQVTPLLCCKLKSTVCYLPSVQYTFTWTAHVQFTGLVLRLIHCTRAIVLHMCTRTCTYTLYKYMYRYICNVLVHVQCTSLYIVHLQVQVHWTIS